MKTTQGQPKTITLYHGTCQCCAQKIMKSGLRSNSCLTNSIEVADYYAEVALDFCDNCDVEVLEVIVNLDNLSVDYAAYEEPLTFYRNNFASNDRDWHDGIESGEIPYPSNDRDYNTALKVTHSVVHTEIVTPDHIKIH